MKETLLHIILLALFIPLMGGCSDWDIDDVGVDDLQVSLSVSVRALPQEGKEIGTGTPDNMHLWVYGSMEDSQDTDGYTLLSYREIDKPSFTESDVFGNPVHTITDLDLPEGKKYKKMFFYVVLNSESVNGLNLNFDGNTTKELLQEATFGGVVSGKDDNAMLMYGESSLEIGLNQTNYEVSIEVERSVAKLEMYFSKEWENSTLTIDDITISSKVGKGYLIKPSSLDDIYTTNKGIDLLNDESAITASSQESYGNFSDDLSNFYEVTLANPYLMENPKGLAWDDNVYSDFAYPDTEVLVDKASFYEVTVKFTIDGIEKERLFYLPPVERNNLYRILIRVASQDVSMKLQVIPWNKVEEIWNYEETLTVNTSGKLQWQNVRGQKDNVVVINNEGSDATSCTFTIASPQEATWMAVLKPEKGVSDAFEFVTDEGASLGMSTSGNVKNGQATLRIRPTDAVYAPNYNTAHLLIYINYMGRTQLVENLMPEGLNGTNFVVRQNPQ